MSSSPRDEPAAEAPRVIGRYALFREIASGGMASVHVGRLLGPVGFARTVAIKRLHAQYAKDPEFVSMFLDEARLAARIRHPNVVPTIDVVAEGSELFLVMEYVQGESLASLVKATRAGDQRIPVPIVVAVLSGVLHGLHAAHEAKSESGAPLGIVHRDVSPQNVLVGVDGVARVLDFGIAKAAGRAQTTREGQIKGKLAYMPPEQIQGAVTRRTDVYAAAVVLWEALTGQRLFRGENPATVLQNVLHAEVQRPSELVPELPPAIDDVVLRGLARDPRERFATAREMARALEEVVRGASPAEVGEWVERVAGATLGVRASVIAEIESGSHRLAIRGEPGAFEIEAAPPSAAPEVPTRIQRPSEETAAPLAAPSSSRRRIALVALALVVAGVLGIVTLRRGGGEPEARASGGATEPHAIASATGAAIPSADAARDVAEAASAPSASVTAPPSTEPSAPAVAPTTTAAPKKAVTKPKAKKPSCDPPFEFDANGKKHYKAECL